MEPFARTIDAAKK
jgi:dihydrofolate reductase